eukprot:GHVN01003385.1.p1 GENE.GHVN01003385.1~~GHVN01003385.1.p1  ORF type:complete len:1062 (-),score=214.21 GHVN01003385.1:109-3294(-)
MPVSGVPDKLYIGREVARLSPGGVLEDIRIAQGDKCDFLVIPISSHHPEFVTVCERDKVKEQERSPKNISTHRPLSSPSPTANHSPSPRHAGDGDPFQRNCDQHTHRENEKSFLHHLFLSCGAHNMDAVMKKEMEKGSTATHFRAMGSTCPSSTVERHRNAAAVGGDYQADGQRENETSFLRKLQHRSLMGHQPVPVEEYRLTPSTGTDLCLDSRMWTSSIVGAVSPWICLDGCMTDEYRHFCSEALLKELRWASHCCMYATICPTPFARCANYARLISNFLQSPVATQLWMRIPVRMKVKGEFEEERVPTLTRGYVTHHREHTPPFAGAHLNRKETELFHANPTHTGVQRRHSDLAVPTTSVNQPFTVSAEAGNCAFLSTQIRRPRPLTMSMGAASMHRPEVIDVPAPNHMNTFFPLTSLPSFGPFCDKINVSGPRIVSGWSLWNQFRSLCANQAAKVGVALELVEGLTENDMGEICSWFGEPVKAIIIPSNLFVPNSKGYPILPKVYKWAVQQFLRHKVQLIVRLSYGYNDTQIDGKATTTNLTVAGVGGESDTELGESEVRVDFGSDDESPKTGDALTSDETVIYPPLNAQSAHKHEKEKKANVTRSSPHSPKHQEAIEQINSKVSSLTMSNMTTISPRDAVVGGERFIPKLFMVYLGRLFHQLPPLSEEELFEYPYWDYLQSPLQPLQDNLESQTYETFEKDPVKYKQYEKAIHAALIDLLDTGTICPTLAVVGAGRGPIVQSAINALREADVKEYHLYAVEKNQNAAITIRGRIAYDRDPAWRSVKLVETDMRHWETSEKFHLLISELLGSFGDNELSPECLDGAQRFLHPNGSMIPACYWSAVEPISAAKLWLDCKASSTEGLKGVETPYVVRLHSYRRVSHQPPVRCFTFEHPNVLACHKPVPVSKVSDEDESAKVRVSDGGVPVEVRETRQEALIASGKMNGNVHNERYKQIRFIASSDATVHGFAGYFHCQLYQDVTLSIHPMMASEGMFSWFPLFIPINRPYQVSCNDMFCLHIWRADTPHKSWYEWSVEMGDGRATEVHNVGGKHYSIGK